MDAIERRLWKIRNAWLSRIRVDPRMFEEAVKDDELTATGVAVLRNDDPQKKIDDIAKKLRWQVMVMVNGVARPLDAR
jgi:hypothetical protein